MKADELEKIIKETQSALEYVIIYGTCIFIYLLRKLLFIYWENCNNFYRDEDSDEEATTSQSDAKRTEKIPEAGVDEYNFQGYDDESKEINWTIPSNVYNLINNNVYFCFAGGNMYCAISSLASFDGTNGKDPFITNDDEDSEEEDDIIKPDDNLVLVGHVENDASILEVFGLFKNIKYPILWSQIILHRCANLLQLIIAVHNEREGSFYCHHDILLPSFPLCIEWLNYDSADIKPGE